jgi:hypothetical protein
MGRGRQTEGPVPIAFIREAFVVGSNSGALLHGKRLPDHFTHRTEDAGRFNAMYAGKEAAF